MNKKDARKKRHEAEKKQKRDILDSEIIGADDENSKAAETIADGEEEETLLGRLAKVKQIPILPWHDEIVVLPLGQRIINFPQEEAADWMLNLFRETAEKDHDLIGLLPIKDSHNPEELMREMLTSRIGMAAQVREVKKTEIGTNLIELWGICRFEILNRVVTKGKYGEFNIRWFEDEAEPDEILRPLHTEFVKLVQRMAKMRGKALRFYQDAENFPEYTNDTVQYDSFMFVDRSYGWFTFEEQIELLKMTSTSERFHRVIERAQTKLPEMGDRWKLERRTKNN